MDIVVACLVTLVDASWNRDARSDTERYHRFALQCDRVLATTAAVPKLMQWNRELVGNLRTRPWLEVGTARPTGRCDVCGKETTSNFMVTLSGPAVDGPACLIRTGEPANAWVARLPSLEGGKGAVPRRYRVGPVCRESMIRTHTANFIKLHVVSAVSRVVLDAAKSTPGDTHLVPPLTDPQLHTIISSPQFKRLRAIWDLVFDRVTNMVTPMRAHVLTPYPPRLTIISFAPPPGVGDDDVSSGCSSDDVSSGCSSDGGDSCGGSSDGGASCSGSSDGGDSCSGSSSDGDAIPPVARRRKRSRVVVSDSEDSSAGDSEIDTKHENDERQKRARVEHRKRGVNSPRATAAGASSDTETECEEDYFAVATSDTESAASGESGGHRRSEPGCTSKAASNSPYIGRGGGHVTDIEKHSVLMMMKCSLCRDVWAVPHVLPCKHVFCYKCLQMWLTKGDIGCPECHTEVSGIDVAKRNTLATKLLEMLMAGRTEEVLWRERCKEGALLEATEMGRRAFNRWTGRGCTKNQSEAYELWRGAADRGDVYSRGACLTFGIGTPRDLSAAAACFRDGANRGDAYSQHFLGSCFHYGTGVAKDVANAVKWYRMAALQGHADAQNNLGVLYTTGQGVAKNPEEAAKWYRKAAVQGIGDAQLKVGICLKFGIGVAKNEAEAAMWFRKAATRGHVQAQCFLGVCLKQGQGVTRDLKEAAKWLRRAADQGCAKARSVLSRIG